MLNLNKLADCIERVIIGPDEIYKSITSVTKPVRAYQEFAPMYKDISDVYEYSNDLSIVRIHKKSSNDVGSIQTSYDFINGIIFIEIMFDDEDICEGWQIVQIYSAILSSIIEVATIKFGEEEDLMTNCLCAGILFYLKKFKHIKNDSISVFAKGVEDHLNLEGVVSSLKNIEIYSSLTDTTYAEMLNYLQHNKLWTMKQNDKDA